MISLRRRLVLAASAVLLAFFGLTGAALDGAFRQSALRLVEERLQAHVYAVLATAEMDASGTLVLAGAPPEPRLSTPASGLYALVRRQSGGVVWQSASLLGDELRPLETEAPGVAVFEGEALIRGRAIFSLAFPVEWEAPNGDIGRYVVQVAEETTSFEAQLGRFRRSLWGWLVGAAVALLAAQALLLAYGLAPLGRLAAQVAQVRAGEREQLEGPQPPELAPLAHSLNALIEVSERRLERYRNSMSDLAHSLKTPLSVMRAASDAEVEALKTTVAEQVERMDRAVSYQLSRATTSGKLGFGEAVEVAPVVEALANSLAKVYAERALQIRFEASPECRFSGDRDDLTEILGNLMDNACKWAARQVSVRAGQPDPDAPLLVLEVEDDGIGIDSAALLEMRERGARADLAVPGQGIGLAIVSELVFDAYQGTLEAVEGELGGACIRVTLPAGPPSLSA